MIQKVESLPEGLEKFIRSHFKTITQVEMLCYFFNHKEIVFSSSTLCHLLLLSENMTLQSLDRLIALGYVAQKDSFFEYIKGSPAETNGLLKGLVDLFETRKSLIVEILFDSFMTGEK